MTRSWAADACRVHASSHVWAVWAVGRGGRAPAEHDAEAAATLLGGARWGTACLLLTCTIAARASGAPATQAPRKPCTKAWPGCASLIRLRWRQAAVVRRWSGRPGEEAGGSPAALEGARGARSPGSCSAPSLALDSRCRRPAGAVERTSLPARRPRAATVASNPAARLGHSAGLRRLRGRVPLHRARQQQPLLPGWTPGGVQPCGGKPARAPRYSVGQPLCGREPRAVCRLPLTAAVPTAAGLQRPTARRLRAPPRWPVRPSLLTGPSRLPVAGPHSSTPNAHPRRSAISLCPQMALHSIHASPRLAPMSSRMLTALPHARLPAIRPRPPHRAKPYPSASPSSLCSRAPPLTHRSHLVSMPCAPRASNHNFLRCPTVPCHKRSHVPRYRPCLLPLPFLHSLYPFKPLARLPWTSRGRREAWGRGDRREIAGAPCVREREPECCSTYLGSRRLRPGSFTEAPSQAWWAPSGSEGADDGGSPGFAVCGCRSQTCIRSTRAA